MTDEKQEHIEQAQATINRLYDENRAYIPALIGQLFKTYAPPLVAVILMGTFGAPLFIEVGGNAGNITALILNIFILLFGFRWTENRFKGTNLFVTYVAVGRTRRELQSAMQADESTAAIIIEREKDFISISEGFVAAMQTIGANPVEVKSDK